jgi:hypothetical protein
MAQPDHAPIFDDLQQLADMGADTPEDREALWALYREVHEQREAALASTLGGKTLELMNDNGTLLSSDESQSVLDQGQRGAYDNGRRA